MLVKFTEGDKDTRRQKDWKENVNFLNEKSLAAIHVYGSVAWTYTVTRARGWEGWVLSTTIWAKARAG